MLVKKNLDKRTQIEVEGSPVEIFQAIAVSQEIFMDEPCQLCKTESVFRVRSVESNGKGKKGAFSFYEKVCQNPECRAKLAFGISSDGSGLFPKRKLEDGSWDYKARGWSRFVPEPAR